MVSFRASSGGGYQGGTNNNSDGNSDSNSDLFFIPNDEELLSLLLRTEDPLEMADPKTKEDLQGLVDRFRKQDVNANFDEHFNRTIISTVQSIGFLDCQPTPTTSTSEAQAQPQQQPPSAFETEQGKKHVKAVSSVLQVTTVESIQLTLGALATLQQQQQPRLNNNPNSNSQFLLGTSDMVLRTVEYHCRQRVARLSAIAVLLVLERQQQDSTDGRENSHSFISGLLDSVDCSFPQNRQQQQKQQQPRGLFRRFLSVMCQTDLPIPREDLLPCKDLMTSAVSGPSAQAHAQEWRQFVTSLLEMKRAYALQERLEAVTALTMLLYHRLSLPQSMLDRADFYLFLTALSSCNQFFTGFKAVMDIQRNTTTSAASTVMMSPQIRLCRLAGLAGAECVSLWKALGPSDREEEEDGNEVTGYVRWVQNHALLEGLLDPPESGSHQMAVKELKLLTDLMERLAETVLRRREWGTLAPPESPESLAVFSYGLLLQIAHNDLSVQQKQQTSEDANDGAYWRSLGMTGEKLVDLANECDAFSYLQTIMESLVVAPSPFVNSQSDPLQNNLYLEDATTIADSPSLLTLYMGKSDNRTVPDASAASQAYASIGREIFIAVLSVYRDLILSSHHSSFVENMTAMSAAVSVIFCNLPFMCQQFWNEWEDYTEIAAVSGPQPHMSKSASMCLLLEKAYHLAANTLNQSLALTTTTTTTTTRAQSERDCLAAISPFFVMLSSLVYDSFKTEDILMSSIPPGLIHYAVILCQATANTNSTAEEMYEIEHLCSTVLDAIGKIARIASSPNCREILRSYLEGEDESGSQTQYIGPRLLLRIISGTRAQSSKTDSSAALQRSVFTLISELLIGAPVGWIIVLAQALGSMLLDAKSDVFRGLFAFDNDSAQVAVRVIDGLVQQMNNVLFSPEVDDSVAQGFLSIVELGVRSASDFLSASLSTTSNRMSRGLSFSYDLAKNILDCIGGVLKVIRPVLRLHESDDVRERADQLRNRVISDLVGSNGFGDAVMFYAVAPVCLNLACRADCALHDADVLQVMSSQQNVDGYDRVFRSTNRNNPASDYKINYAANFLSESLFNVETLSFDFESARARGWLVDEAPDAILCSSLSALLLLSLWSKHSEEMTNSEPGSRTESESPDMDSDPSISDLTLSPYRLLSCPGCVPPVVRIENRELSTAWKKIGASNFTLLLPLLNIKGDDDLPPVLAFAAYDFLITCMIHAKNASGTDIETNDDLLRNIYRSSPFRRVMESTIKRCVSLSKSTNPVDFNRTSVALVLRGLRLLAACVDLSSAVGWNMLGADKASRTVDSLVDLVTAVVDEFKQGKMRSSSRVFEDHILMNKLQIAARCTSILRSLWLYARSPAAGHIGNSAVSLITSVVDDEDSLVPSLASFVFNNADIQDAVPSDGEYTSNVWKFSLLSLISSAFDILSVDVCKVLSTARIDDELPIIRCLAREAERDLARLASSTGNIMRVHSFNHLTLALQDLASCVLTAKVKLPSTYALVQLLSTTGTVLEPTKFVEFNGYDFLVASQWFISLQTQGFALQTETGELLKVISAHNLLSCEIMRLSSCKTFLKSFRLLMEKKRSETPSDASIISQATLSWSLVMGVLDALLRNLQQIESAQPNLSQSEYFLLESTFKIARASTDLLDLTDMGDSVMISDDVVQALAMISDCSRAVLEVVRTSLRGFDLLQRLFALASQVLSLHLTTTQNQAEPVKWEGIILQLCSTACKAIRSVEEIAAPGNINKVYEDCFCATVSLLSVLVSGSRERQRSEGRFSLLSKLRGTFVDSDIIRSIVRQTGMRQGLLYHPYSNVTHDSQQASDVVLFWAAKFFNSLVASGDEEMIKIVVDHEAFQILSKMQSSFDGVEVHSMRGYTPTTVRNNPRIDNMKTWTILEGLDDPLHRTWIELMKLVAYSLKSSASGVTLKSGDRSRIHSVALNFLHIHQEVMLICLKHCSSCALGPKSLPMTRNLLKEASITLFIISELCSADANETFKTSFSSLYSECIREAFCLLATFSSILGASGASRELFQLLSAYDAADDYSVNHGLQFAALSSISHVLAGGVRNANHEAIRYSHFVSRCTAAVTEKDRLDESSYPDRWAPHGLDLTASDQSVSSLQTKCRLSVTSNFSFKMEEAIAECLFFVVSILWKTHPVSSSFTMFTDDEVAACDFMSLIEPGVVIAYKAQENVASDWKNAADRKRRLVEQPLFYGQVLHRDTFKRSWRVRMLQSPLGEGTKECQVSHRQLAGVENPMNRKSILDCVPAPETSAELEDASKTVTVGHLILVLRWCHQAFNEMSGQAATPMNNGLILRLAELSATFLGYEIAIHKRNGSFTRLPKPETGKLLCAQLLELFGDESDYEDSFAEALQRDGRVRGAGRLHDLLQQQHHQEDATLWAAIRAQLHSELESARQDLAAKLFTSSQERSPRRRLSATMPMAEGESWSYETIRRPSVQDNPPRQHEQQQQQSPFRGMGMRR